MTIFDSKETEKRYCSIAKKYGIIHVLWPQNHIVTESDIDGLIRDVTGAAKMYVSHEPFQDSP